MSSMTLCLPIFAAAPAFPLRTRNSTPAVRCPSNSTGSPFRRDRGPASPRSAILTAVLRLGLDIAPHHRQTPHTGRDEKTPAPVGRHPITPGMPSAILCLSCDYDLAATDSGRCPECGRAFDPANPATFESRRRGSQALLGIALAIGLAAAAFGLLRWSWEWPYADSHHAAFRTIFGIGAALGVVAALLAARNRSWFGRIPLLLVGTLCAWAGLFFASEKYFRVWQSSPDPPDEAFADTGPIGALLAGWIPGGLLVGVVFALGLLFFAWRRRVALRSIVLDSAPPNTPTAPPTSPPPR